jgi:hypothetical protein
MRGTHQLHRYRVIIPIKDLAVVTTLQSHTQQLRRGKSHFISICSACLPQAQDKGENLGAIAVGSNINVDKIKFIDAPECSYYVLNIPGGEASWKLS